MIIPALNEAGHLPALLAALDHQTLRPAEVIIADAGSHDGTPVIACAHGAHVVSGGRPPVGRNAGARAARSELLLFLDADVVPPPDFLAMLLQGFRRQAVDVAAPLLTPISARRSDHVCQGLANLYLQAVQPISPHAPGCCILVRRSLHERIGGFDERAAMAEDHDYVRRARRHGRYKLLRTVRLPVSVRRIEAEGVLRLAVKYAYCELHVLARRPVHSVPFTYAFGLHERR